jgi:hypothetical protein
MRQPASDWHPIPLELVVLVVSALSEPEVGETIHELDRFDPLDLLEADLALISQPQRRTMGFVERLAVLLGYPSGPVLEIDGALEDGRAPTLVEQ